MKELDKLKAKYNFQLTKDKAINRLDGLAPSFGLEGSNIKEIFALINKSDKTQLFDTTLQVVVVKAENVGSDPAKDKKEGKEDYLQKGQELIISRQLNQDLLKTIEDQVKPKVYNLF